MVFFAFEQLQSEANKLASLSTSSQELRWGGGEGVGGEMLAIFRFWTLEVRTLELQFYNTKSKSVH